MTCTVCGSPSEWTGPSPITGRVQGWRRIMEHTRTGWRCADLPACKRRAAAAAPDTLF